jgi:hypothetical protein
MRFPINCLARRNHPARHRGARPVLEALENRRVPTILFDRTLGAESAFSLGGTELPNPTVYLIFHDPKLSWGDPKTQQPSPSAGNILTAVKNLLNSPYLAGIGKSSIHKVSGAAQFGGFCIDTTALASGVFGTKEIDTLVHNVVGNKINGIPDDSSNIYLVVTAPGVTSGFAGDVGFHFPSHIVPGWAVNLESDLAEGWVGSPGNVATNSQSFLDSVTTVFSHELVESITDPWLHGVQATAGANFKVTDDGECEIADFEAVRYTYRVNGTLAQAFWSENSAQMFAPFNTPGFIVNDGTTQVFEVSGGPKGTLLVNGDLSGVITNDTISVDMSPTGGVRVTINGENATFEPNTISKVVVNPGTSLNGYNHVNVMATKVPVTINDTDPHGDIVTVGKNGNVQGVQGTVTLNNSSPNTSLTVDNQFDSVRTYTVDVNAVQVTGTAGSITWNGPALLHDLTIWAGGNRSLYPSANSITVRGVAGVSGGGGSTRPAETLVTVHACPGYDNFVVGSDLSSIRGWLTIAGQSNTTSLTLDDSINSNSPTYTVGFQTVGRSNLTYPIGFSGLSQLILVGASGADTFQVVAPAPPCPTFLYGTPGQANHLIGPDGWVNDWTIDQKFYGTLRVGVDKAAATITFNSIPHLKGGNGVDTFQIKPAGEVSNIDGGGGSDWLDYSWFGLNQPVTVDLQAGTATNVWGAATNLRNVLGGMGNDSLSGGPGGNVLVGGDGNDTIRGGPDGDILIGDSGADSLTAGAFGDILIGGWTDHEPVTDVNRAVLQSILDEWRLDSSYRFTHLASGWFNGWGINGSNLLNSNTVHDDVSTDTLTGGGGVDWFFRHLGGPDLLNNKSILDPTYNY